MTSLEVHLNFSKLQKMTIELRIKIISYLALRSLKLQGPQILGIWLTAH